MICRMLKVATLAGAVIMGASAGAEDGARVLFMSKSAGFEHSSIKQENGQPSHVDGVLSQLAAKMQAKVTSTKDAGQVNAENLKNFDVVIFYTTGDLTTPGTDKNPPMSSTGVQELIAWVRNGGGFMAYHCGSDTLHRTDAAPESPYLDMLGGEFLTHGKQFVGKLIVVDKDHPAMAHFQDGWEVNDEWYTFKNMLKEKIHVLALLDPRDQRQAQPEKYNIANYPVVWCSQEGKGRVYYNAMGHREDVWDNPDFQQTVVDAINWASGKGPADADPNFADVAPSSVDISGGSVAKN